MLYYIVVELELDLTIYLPYLYYNDIVRYYNPGDALHTSEVVNSHYTLAIL